jgi:DNA-binding SARP family transcriptional activator
MRFLVLGPPRVVTDHGDVRLGVPRQQALLVALVLNANRPVPGNRLVECLWPRRPRYAALDLRALVNGLHEALGSVDKAAAERLAKAGDGFALHLEPGEADCLQFTHLLGQGEAALAADDFYAAAHLFTEAMSLWRGTAGGGVVAYGSLRRQLAALEALRPRTIERIVKAWSAVDDAPDEAAEVRPNRHRWEQPRRRAGGAAGRPRSRRGAGRAPAGPGQ